MTRSVSSHVMRRPPAARLGWALVFACARALASRDPPATAEPAHAAFVSDQRGLMTVLAGWSVGSIAVGAKMWSSSQAVVRFAGAQNVIWGAIDGAIAGYAIYDAGRNENARGDGRGERDKLGHVFRVNVGLDILYVAVGLTLVLRGRKGSVRGSGAGVLVQGAFLFVFDIVGARVIGTYGQPY